MPAMPTHPDSQVPSSVTLLQFRRRLHALLEHVNTYRKSFVVTYYGRRLVVVEPVPMSEEENRAEVPKGSLAVQPGALAVDPHPETPQETPAKTREKPWKNAAPRKKAGRRPHGPSRK
jgi:hypothetical protein